MMMTMQMTMAMVGAMAMLMMTMVRNKKGIPGKKQKEKHFLSKSQLSAPRQKHE